jgi:hypothetical protein
MVLPELVGMVGLSGGRLIVRSETEVLALDRAGGRVLWRFAAPEMHSFCLAGDDMVLVPLRERSTEKKDHWLTRFVWLDATTGRPTAATTLPRLTDADPRLGPLVPFRDRIFTFFGRGQHDPVREVVELLPAGNADPPRLADAPLSAWVRVIPAPVADAVNRVLPDWQFLSGTEGNNTGFLANHLGETNVAGVQSPVVLGRWLSLPTGGKPRLRMRVGVYEHEKWNLEVRLGSQVLHQVEINSQAFPQRWNNLDIDLSPAAGKEGWLLILTESQGGGHTMWWKSADVAF